MIYDYCSIYHQISIGNIQTGLTGSTGSTGLPKVFIIEKMVIYMQD